MKRKLLAVLLACLLVWSCAGMAGAANAAVYFGDAKVENDVITVTLAVRGNTASSGSFTVSYDGKLTLQEARSELALSDIHTDAGKVSFAWTETAKEDLVLLRLTFSGAKTGTYTFPVEEQKAFDGEYHAIDTQALRLVCTVGNHDDHCPSKAFRDVDTSRWYHEAVDFVLNEGIMIGMSKEEFAPNGAMTRGMIVKVLGAMEKIDTAKYQKTNFTDVNMKAWYGPYVAWAEETGVVKGFEDGTFRPNAQVTREQLVTILYRYWQAQGNTWTVDTTVFDTFQDKNTVSNYAKEAMQWATAQKLVNGKAEGQLMPKDGSTRAEMAKLILCFRNME